VADLSSNASACRFGRSMLCDFAVRYPALRPVLRAQAAPLDGGGRPRGQAPRRLSQALGAGRRPAQSSARRAATPRPSLNLLRCPALLRKAVHGQRFAVAQPARAKARESSKRLRRPLSWRVGSRPPTGAASLLHNSPFWKVVASRFAALRLVARTASRPSGFQKCCYVNRGWLEWRGAAGVLPCRFASTPAVSAAPLAFVASLFGQALRAGCSVSGLRPCLGVGPRPPQGLAASRPLACALRPVCPPRGRPPVRAWRCRCFCGSPTSLARRALRSRRAGAWRCNGV